MGTAYRPLGTTSSLVRYTRSLTTLVHYVISVAKDPSLDADLALSHTHIDTARLLLGAIEQQTKEKSVKAALENLTHLLSPIRILHPPHYFKKDTIPSVLWTAYASLEDAFHAFMRTLLLYPDHQVGLPSKLKTPIGRFLALLSWSTTNGIFLDTRQLFTPMAHLQWGMRMIGLVEYQKLCLQRPETNTYSYAFPKRPTSYRSLTPPGAFSARFTTPTSFRM